MLEQLALDNTEMSTADGIVFAVSLAVIFWQSPTRLPTWPPIACLFRRISARWLSSQIR